MFFLDQLFAELCKKEIKSRTKNVLSVLEMNFELMDVFLKESCLKLFAIKILIMKKKKTINEDTTFRNEFGNSCDFVYDIPLSFFYPFLWSKQNRVQRVNGLETIAATCFRNVVGCIANESLPLIVSITSSD